MDIQDKEAAENAGKLLRKEADHITAKASEFYRVCRKRHAAIMADAEILYKAASCLDYQLALAMSEAANRERRLRTSP